MNYEIYCGPRRCVRALAPGEMPPEGAHLVTPWMGYTHHGIHVGDGKVVHYGALMYAHEKATSGWDSLPAPGATDADSDDVDDDLSAQAAMA